LHRHLIIDAILEIQPEVRRRQPARTQRGEQRIRHVLLREPDLAGARAINIDAQLGAVHPLLQMDVGRSADLRHPGLDLLGQGKVFGAGSGDLDIDGRGQAEVQNLAHDIRSRKRELHVRKIALKPFPEHAHIVRRGTVMLRVERHEDFAVGGTDGGIVAEGEIDAAGRQYGAHLVLGKPHLFDRRVPVKRQKRRTGIFGVPNCFHARRRRVRVGR